MKRMTEKSLNEEIITRWEKLCPSSWNVRVKEDVCWQTLDKLLVFRRDWTDGRRRVMPLNITKACRTVTLENLERFLLGIRSDLEWK